LDDLVGVVGALEALLRGKSVVPVMIWKGRRRRRDR